MVQELDSCSEVNITAIRDTFLHYDYPHVNSTFSSTLTNTHLFKITVTSLVVLAALFGNLGIVIAVAFNRTLRTTINFYLVNLAVADLLICTCCMAVDLINNLTEPVFVLGPIVCKMNAFCQMTCLTSSVLTLSAIACDRFIAILYPLQARFRVTKHRTGILIIVIWVTSLFVSIPFLIVRKYYVLEWRNFDQPNCEESWPSERTPDLISGSCITTHTTKKVYYTFVTIALFFIPIIVMATAYACVVWRLWANVLPGEQTSANVNHQHQAKKKVVKMVCLMLAAFVICWAPLQVVVLYSQFVHSTDYGELPAWFQSASYFATFIAYCNSAINPIIYGGFNKSFRDALLNIFKCKCRRDPFAARRSGEQK